eukprot:SAG22_NODE_403_length_11012_cov_12.141024_1_plen_57_part_00
MSVWANMSYRISPERPVTAERLTSHTTAYSDGESLTTTTEFARPLMRTPQDMGDLY